MRLSLHPRHLKCSAFVLHPHSSHFSLQLFRHITIRFFPASRVCYAAQVAELFSKEPQPWNGSPRSTKKSISTAKSARTPTPNSNFLTPGNSSSSRFRVVQPRILHSRERALLFPEQVTKISAFDIHLSAYPDQASHAF